MFAPPSTAPHTAGIARSLARVSSAPPPSPSAPARSPSLAKVATAVAATLAAVGGTVCLYLALRHPSRHHGSDDDDDDMFATAAGPRQLSPDAVRPTGKAARAPGPTAAAPLAAVGGKGPGHAYSKTMSPSRGRSRSQAAVASAEASTPGRSRPVAATTSAVTAAVAAADPTKGKGGSEIFTKDIAERTNALNLVRALLGRVEGLEYEESSESESDSDETDVSLNYHIATELEASARDELMDAFAEYEMGMQEKMERHQLNELAGRPHEEEDDTQELEEMAPVLAKMTEYLDISNEREKLRVRRQLLHTAQRVTGTTAAGTHTRFVTDTQDEEGNAGEDDDDAAADEALARRRRAAAASKFRDDTDAMRAQALQRLMELTGAAGDHPGQGNAAAMDQALARAAAAEAAEDAEAAEMFEDEWEDDDAAMAEAAFMEYLQQDDDARPFYSRQEVEQRRQKRRDPTAMRVVGADGRDFDDVLEDWVGRGRGTRAPAQARHTARRDFDAVNDDDNEDDDAFGDFPSDPAAQQALYRRLMGFDDEDEEDTEDYGFAGESAPWTDEEKAEFEANLLERVHDMAELWGVTAAEGERELAKEERERAERKEARRAARAAAAAGGSKDRAVPSAPDMASTKTRDVAAHGAQEDDGEEEEDVWEDVDDEDVYEDLPDEDEGEGREVSSAAHAPRFHRRPASGRTQRF